MKTLIALTVLTAVGMAVIAGVTVAVVCRCLARGEAADEHDCGGTCPAHDVGPDDLMDLAEAVGVVRKPFALDVAVDTVIRHMPIDESTAWVATARDIGHLDTYDAAEWSR